MSTCRNGVAAIGMGLLVAGTHVSAAGPYDGAVRTLQGAVTSSREGTDQAMLIALRQMRDPTTRHLFERLLDHEQWQIQVHAVLGLCELADPPAIDPVLLDRVSRRAQEAVVVAAIDMEMLDVDGMRALLETNQLKSLVRLLLWAELHSLGEPIDVEAVRAMAAHDDDRVAALASCLLAANGDSSGFSAFRHRLDATSGTDHQNLALWLIEVIRAYKIKETMDWVRSVLEDPDVKPELAAAGVVTALELEPETGLQMWRHHLGAEPSKMKRVQFGLLLLAADPRVPASAYDAFENDQDLVQRMAAAGRALSSGQPASDDLIQLIDLGHELTAGWAIEIADTLDPVERDRVWAHVIDNIEIDQPGQGERASRAVRATTLLYRVSPDLVRERLAAAEDDGVTQQTILMGLLKTKSPGAGDDAVSIRRIGAGFADSLAILLIARREVALPDSDRTHLGLIAAGGVPLPPGLQAQAAWLYLRHTASIERGLNDLLDDDSSGS